LKFQLRESPAAPRRLRDLARLAAAAAAAAANVWVHCFVHPRAAVAAAVAM